ncbi:MAG: hypothetical protein RR065_06375 [Clostridia bacterium]
MRKRIALGIWIVLLAAFLPVLAAVGEAGESAVSVREVRTEIGGNAIAYPQLQGMADEAVQQKINDDIVLSGDVTSHMITLTTLKDSSWGLQLRQESFLAKDVFSTVLCARGKLPTGREGQAYTALSYDLQTGERLTLADLLTDVDGAVAWMEAEAQRTLGDELNDYLEHSNVAPLPVGSFYLDAEGICFYYPAEQFQLLSGDSGACRFFYEELARYLRTDEAGIPARINALPKTYTVAQQKASIQKAVEEGALAGVPVKLGEPLTGLVERFGLLRTPDEFPGGRYYLLEEPHFREVRVISDSMQSGYEHSVVEGVQLLRGSFCGLQIGSSVRSEWVAALGEHGETIAFTEGMANDYALPVGQSDLYRFGAYELRLHADENGVLRCIQLGK